MNRPLLKKILLTISIFIAAISGVAGNISFFCHFDLQWHENGLYHWFTITDGTLVLVRLNQCQLPADGKIWYEVEWQNRSLLHRLRQIESDEPTGFTVERKRWIPGFEYAKGDFWPPFVWHHPKMRFQRIRISLVVVFILGSVYPAYGLVQRVRRGAPTRAEAADRTSLL
ncbi:MAG: hypothetical protein WCJ09_01700 [Planctomycetota bacterium]